MAILNAHLEHPLWLRIKRNAYAEPKKLIRQPLDHRHSVRHAIGSNTASLLLLPE